ncbi:ATP-binding cassette domain-containing protein [Enterococcus sp. MJM12]|uniref:ATP-binding cassette domain-containing protein n=1 Tax=Candidatus Enterococcus myersii TaxID=2815322 RepID=A0ABS3HA37_9ENTE|nr:ATP-binding cassette domain-containing protein [Enterococcus sp. MJM12]MBO0450313.1 ATP-binding cassette domain-containing protein [Enterococcus sp. MJM12]
MIEVKEVSKVYQQKIVLDKIELQLPKGELVAFIGPNGAGKSTLLSIMSRLQGEFSGELFIDNGEIRTWHSKELAKRLAILKQNNQLQARLTVAELVAFGRFPYSRGRLNEADKKIVSAAIAAMSLTDLAAAELQNLSGGQLQRAYIAMILAQDTEYILLDEPLNNLDMNHANQMMRLLKKLVKETNKTIFLVIHDINFAAAFADTIVALKDGALFKIGTAAEVITSEVLGELYEMEVRVCELMGKRVCMYFDATDISG